MTVGVRHLPPLLPFLPPLCAPPQGEPNDVHQEDPGQGVHGHAATLDKKPGPGRHQLAVQHGAAHENPHGDEEQHEERVHGLPEPRGVLPRLFEEPAGLQQRVGDLAAEQDGAALDAGLAQPQGQQDSQDAHGVVGQHDGPLRAEVHAPGHVEHEVAQAQHQGADLEGRVPRTCGSSTKQGEEAFTCKEATLLSFSTLNMAANRQPRLNWSVWGWIYALVLTWVREGPGPVHIAYVRRDAHRQDAVQQGDQATVPLVAPGPVNAA